MSGAGPPKSWTTLSVSATGSADQLMPVAADGSSAAAVFIVFIYSCSSSSAADFDWRSR